MSERSLGERAFIGLQYLLPQHALSWLVGRIAASRIGFLRYGLIRAFLAHYPVDMAEAAETDPTRYLSINASITKVANSFYLNTEPRVYVDRAPRFVGYTGITLSEWHGWSGSIRFRAINRFNCISGKHHTTINRSKRLYPPDSIISAASMTATPCGSDRSSSRIHLSCAAITRG